MGWFQRLRDAASTQFIEILEWVDDTGEAIVWRFPVRDHEIKMGAQLTVRENQWALFVNEGVAADLFGPGRWTLITRNIPVLTKLKGWKHGFASPFKAEVYFFSRQCFTDLQWGTSQPVLMRDPEFGLVRLRAFGTYAIRIEDPKRFFSTLVGTQNLTTTSEITGQLRSILVARFSDALADARIPAPDLASRYDDLSNHARDRAREDFHRFGIDLTQVWVESISLPDAVQAAIDQRSRLGVLGGDLDAYQRLQAADAITLAAGATGGTAGAGVGLGAGIALGSTMTRAMERSTAPLAGDPPAPPAPDAAARWTLTRDGRNHGPYTGDAIRAMVREGRVQPTDLVWTPGAGGWGAIASYDEFADLAAPPPPPPGR